VQATTNGHRRVFRRFVPVSSAILLPFSIAAEPVVRDYYHYYPVDPESLEDILPSLQAASPIEQDGEDFFWLYRLQCSLTDLVATTKWPLLD
jgi:predicted secreted Zn-dependent protease